MINAPPSHLFQKNYCYQKFYEKLEISPIKCFGTVRQKTSTGPWSAKKISKPKSLWNTKRFLYYTRKFRHSESKNNQGKIMINAPTLPSFPEKLLLPEVLWKTGNFLHQMLRHRETKNIDRTVKCKKNFETKKSLKHQKVPLLYEKVSALWVKKQSRENHDKRPHPPIFSRKIIATRSFMKNWKFPPSNASAPWDKKHRQDREVQKKFQNQKVSETPKCSSTLRESFGTVSQKTIKGKSW